MSLESRVPAQSGNGGMHTIPVPANLDEDNFCSV